MAILLDSLARLPFLGEGLSVLAALFWAGVNILFRSSRTCPSGPSPCSS
jgi:hypothetical protein